MHPSLFVTLLAAQSVAATLQKLRPNPQLGVIGDLLTRQNIGDCSVTDTCSKCFGEGNVLCDSVGCFNPADYEQCCSGAALCIGKDNSCCDSLGGPGVTGKDGVPKTTASDAPGPTMSSWTCTSEDTGEECCQRGSKDIHWCSGKYPNQRCYNSKHQFCCTDGTVCDEKDCCSLFSASVTNPFMAATTGNSGDATTSAPSQTGTNTDSASQPTSTNASGSIESISLRIVGVIASGLGLVLLL